MSAGSNCDSGRFTASGMRAMASLVRFAHVDQQDAVLGERLGDIVGREVVDGHGVLAASVR